MKKIHLYDKTLASNLHQTFAKWAIQLVSELVTRVDNDQTQIY